LVSDVSEKPRNGGAADGVPGGDAEHPGQIPARGWRQIAKRGWKEAKADNVPLLGAGVAFYAFLALFPLLIALVSIYGFFADAAAITEQLRAVTKPLPPDAQKLIIDQVGTLTARGRSTIGVGALVAILISLFSASAGINNLMTAINIAYDEEETRNFLKLRGTALVLTIGAIIFMLLTLGLVAVVPAVLNALELGTVINVGVEIVRWTLLVVLIIVALGILYRTAPDRDAPQFKWTSVGAVVAAVLFVLASFGFSFYVNNFGNYNKTYGALAGVIVLLLWLYLTAYIILLGAEINAESEKQTKQDTTKGPPLPMGERRAEAADTLADPPEPAKKK
jgi:membrane protein